jgi:hypothetical protein
MEKNTASAEGAVGAPAEVVYRIIADMREHHHHFLPPAFSDFEVESGGVGEGTVIRYKLTAGGRTRDYRTVVAEPEPGVITETDTNSSAVTSFAVTPQGGTSAVRITTTWDRRGGFSGLMEHLFAPRVMRGIFADELKRLDAYARQHAAG